VGVNAFLGALREWAQQHIDYLAVALAVLFLFFLFFRLFKKRPLPYKRVMSIVTGPEKRFFFALQEAVGEKYYIFTKVRMADVLLPVSAKDRSRWQRAFNKVACKHFDYVLCDAELKIVLAIELDDASHQRSDRQERDKFVDWACKSAGFVLVRVTPQKRYDVRALRTMLLKHTGK